MTNTMRTIDEIIDQCFSGEVSWTYDQLDGTSMVADALDDIEKEKAEAKQALSTMVSEILGESHETNTRELSRDEDMDTAIQLKYDNLTKNNLLDAQRQRATDRGFTL